MSRETIFKRRRVEPARCQRDNSIDSMDLDIDVDMAIEIPETLSDVNGIYPRAACEVDQSNVAFYDAQQRFASEMALLASQYKVLESSNQGSVGC